MLDSTVAHFYAWLRTRDMPELDKLVWSAGVAARVPGWIMEDRRSPHRLQPQLLPPLQGPARARAAASGQGGAAGLHPAAHPARGDPPHPRAQAPRRQGRSWSPARWTSSSSRSSTSRDELIAARLVERVGRFTGELAEPPLTADGRASLTARLAADHGVDLADCHAYGDSLADLPMLELVGHPHPINPDFRLSPRGAPAALADRDVDDREGRGLSAGADLHADACRSTSPRRPGCPAPARWRWRRSARRARPARTGCRSARR